MERGLALLQPVQDAFASRCKVTLLLMDADGKAVTLPSEGNVMAMMVQKESFSLIQWLNRVDETCVFDTHPGLKVIISPVKVMGTIQYYIWAGMIVEAETRGLLYEYIESHLESPTTWKNALDDLPDTTNEQKQWLIKELNLLSETISTLLDYDQKEKKRQHIIQGITHASDISLCEQGDNFPSILEEMMKINEDLDFVGFATKSDRECVISHISGGPSYDGLLGASFSIGEGFLGQVMATGQHGCWNKVTHDPRTIFFMNKNIQPHAIVAYSVMKDNQVIGVLFGGSCRKKAVDPLMTDIGRVIANILGLHLMQKDLYNNAFYQIQQVNALMEICQLITKIQDVDKVALMLVDMSLNIVQAKSSSIILFDLESLPDKVRIVSRGLTTGQSEKYAKQVLHEYREKFSNQRGHEQYVPAVRRLEWGDVFECPVVNKKFYGVLSVDIHEKKDEQKAFLTSLAAIGAIAVHYASQNVHDQSQYVTMLHQAMGHWDRDAYEFTQKLKEWALRFAAYLQVTPSELRDIEFACLLSHYNPEFISGVLQQQKGIHRILKDYVSLKSKDPSGAGVRYDSLGGPILAIVSEFLRNNEKLRDTNKNRHIDQSLQDKFRSFVLRGEVVDQQLSIKQEQKKIEGLSNREQEVLHAMVEGLNNKQIATALFISEHTVKNHITNIFHKLGVSDRAGVLAYFYNQQKKK